MITPDDRRTAVQALSARLSTEIRGWARCWADPELRALILRAHRDRRARRQEHRPLTPAERGYLEGLGGFARKDEGR